MSEKADSVIFGSGFAGSIMASVLRRLGKSVVIVDKARHPRFAIGESSTPLANLLLEQLASDYGLPQLKQLSTWGSWQRHFPQLPCGLKRGFTFVQHQEGKRFEELSEPRALLVAASPADEVADTNWYRPDFDAFLARAAAERGAVLMEETTVSSIERCEQGWSLKVHRGCKQKQIHASFIVDASGTRGVLFHHFKMTQRSLNFIPPRWSIYSHFKEVAHFSHFTEKQAQLAGYNGNDAALHHVFEGGWIWVLRFNNGITSAGAVLENQWKERLGKGNSSEKWRALLHHFPSIEEQFARSVPIEPFREMDQVSFCSSQCAGNGWALLPSAAGFIDPLMSTGFPLALLGIQRLARYFQGGSLPGENQLDEYSKATFAELEAVELLVAAMFKALRNLTELTQLSLLYFAAASFSETIQRLKPGTTQLSFLLQNDPQFGPGLRSICLQYIQGHFSSEELTVAVQNVIKTWDVAGLTRPHPEFCYGVNFEDIYPAREKLGVSALDIQRMIEGVEQEIENLRPSP